MADEEKFERFNAEFHLKSDSAKWLVFVHGFGGSARTWKKQTEFFSQHYNLLVLEMHKEPQVSDLEIDKVCRLINNTLVYHEIEKAHFLGFSFSTLICLRFAVLYPEKVDTLIMGGGIVKFNLRTNFLLYLAINFKRWINYMILYRFFAYIILPRKNHHRSRSIFVTEAEKLGYDEFCRWVDLIPQTKPSLRWLDELDDNIKILFVSGSEDHLFLKDTKLHTNKMENSRVEVIENCGHVCSIEQYGRFNDIVYEYLQSAN
ncbi:Pimeloyl-ACP methyl ester carboxylesterase [Methanolobus vulcani]|jgi:pimeloyl-ACP methyl ester carboxylesterase|uniref:Pimeloyl-ACP methyl ester carboxylesterase n=1 Tax=Methanolobus vulcani TaxID=38026 RepID=A0A7Z7AY74_9EURY|nr:alpha/beta hydrolase [Methanolobus vulcani]SDG16625.1 Pimeloyl-ACP methyl ester carboxylesterase [Methanolobus vulcani]